GVTAGADERADLARDRADSSVDVGPGACSSGLGATVLSAGDRDSPALDPRADKPERRIGVADRAGVRTAAATRARWAVASREAGLAARIADRRRRDHDACHRAWSDAGSRAEAVREAAGEGHGDRAVAT